MSPARHILTLLANAESREPIASLVPQWRRSSERRVTRPAKLGRTQKVLHVNFHRQSKPRSRKLPGSPARLGEGCVGAGGFKASVLVLEAPGAVQKRRPEGGALPWRV